MASLGKAQVSIEFLVSFGVILLLFTLFSVIVYQKFVETNEIKIDLKGQRVSNSLAQAINEVYLAGEGASMDFTFPDKIVLSEYEVRFFDGEPTVFLSTERQSWSSPLLTPYINCTLSQCSYSAGVTKLKINATLTINLVRREEKIYLEP